MLKDLLSRVTKITQKKKPEDDDFSDYDDESEGEGLNKKDDQEKPLELNIKTEEVKVQKEVINKDLSGRKDGGFDLQSLLDKLDRLYKEKEEEKEKRLEAEKQVALLDQKAKEVAVRVKAFEDLYRNNIEIMKKLMGSLYKKISDDIQQIKKDNSSKQ